MAVVGGNNLNEGLYFSARGWYVYTCGPAVGPREMEAFMPWFFYAANETVRFIEAESGPAADERAMKMGMDLSEGALWYSADDQKGLDEAGLVNEIHWARQSGSIIQKLPLNSSEWVL